MAINNGRLVIGSTKKRAEQLQFYVSYITNTEPGLSRLYTDENGNLSVDTQLPQAEGQIVVFHNTDEGPVGRVFVAVSVLGALRWVEVIRTSDIVDSRTGGAWDPLSSFYNPLAS